VPALPVKFPSPMGKSLTRLPQPSCTTAADAPVNYSAIQNVYVPQRPCKAPIAPMGKWLTCSPRLTLAQLRMLWSTTASECNRDLQKFPSPRWKIDYELPRLSLAQTAADAPVNYRMYVPQRPDIFPIAPMGDSRLFCSLFAGWRCRCRGRHSDHLIVHHQREHC
jgi:hypothetical protein